NPKPSEAVHNVISVLLKYVPSTTHVHAVAPMASGELTKKVSIQPLSAAICQIVSTTTNSSKRISVFEYRRHSRDLKIPWRERPPARTAPVVVVDAFWPIISFPYPMSAIDGQQVRKTPSGRRSPANCDLARREFR